jgi:hypothetical protein
MRQNHKGSLICLASNLIKPKVVRINESNSHCLLIKTPIKRYEVLSYNNDKSNTLEDNGTPILLILTASRIL